jgi:hypothetical protein
MRIPLSQFLRNYHPPWLLGGWGVKWCAGLGVYFDELQDRIKEGVKARFPELAPTDAYPYLLYERGLLSLSSETTARTLVRLTGVWDTWKWSGTFAGLSNGFVSLGWDVSPEWNGSMSDWPVGWPAPDGKVVIGDCRSFGKVWFDNVDGSRSWRWGHPSATTAGWTNARWSRFWVFVDWYGMFGATAITAGILAEIATTIQKWKASCVDCGSIFYVITAGGWSEIWGPEGIGNWDDADEGGWA